MMKDLINKLTNLEATAPKVTAKKVLTEDSVKPAEVKKPTLKDMFESIAGMKPIPVVGKEGGTQQTGAGFVNVTDPALQNLGKTIGDLAAQKKLQIVVPNQPGQAGTAKPAGTVGTTQGGQGQAMGAGQTMQEDDLDERDEGKPGKNFAKIAKSAGKRYGSKEAGERVAGAVRAKLAKQGKLEEEGMEEDKWSDEMEQWALNKGLKNTGKKNSFQRAADRDNDWALAHRKSDTVKEGAKVDRMVKHIEKSERKLGKSKEKASDIAWATANKRGMLDNKNKKVKEADIPSSQGIDNNSPFSGSGRSMTTLENKEPQVEVVDNEFNRKNYKDLIGKKYPKSKAPAYARVKEISEGAKPDFLDLDKDGNKKESMKKAAADKKKQKVKESMNHRISAARLEGKSHGLKNQPHCGKNYSDLEEMKAYHEGYKEGLDECYGQGVYEAAPGTPPATVGGMANATMEDEFDEGNAFTAALARTPKGGKFSVGGKSFTDHTGYDADLDEAIFNPMGGVARGLRGLKGIVKDTPHAQLPGVMGAGAGAAVGIPAAATAGAVGAAFLPIIGASALGGYGLLKAGQLTGKLLNFLAQKVFGTKEEALAFAKAHLEAAKAGETSFQHNGKTYKVSLKPGQISQLYGDIEDLTNQIKNKEFDKRMAPDTTMGNNGAALKEDPVFESLDKQLNALLNESEEVTEGLSVSVSKGQQNSPDSVTITAQDAEADQLLQLVKHAGLGLFGDEAAHEPSSAMSIQPDHGAADEVGAGGVDIDVVDDSDSMLSLMKKLGGVEQSGSEDYADEEGDEDCGCSDEEETNEATCNECGMYEGMHESGCSMDKEEVEEMQTPDQLEATVAEDNAPDNGSANSTNDTAGNAAANASLAKADEEEDLEESFTFESFYKKLAMLEAKEDTEEEDEKAEEAGKKVTKDIEYDDKKDKKEKVDEWANQVGNGPGKGTDASFEQDIDFMTKVIAGGLNKPKSTGQTTVPIIAHQEDRMHDNPKDWATLAGIKKA